MTPEQLLDEFRTVFDRRRFSAGLLIAFIRFLRDLGAFGRGFASLDDFLQAFPLSAVSARGGQANALTVEVPDSRRARPRLVSIRPAYNEVETFFRVTNKRFDYPNCAPHATGQWRDYRHWLDALVTFSHDETAHLEDAVIRHVLDELGSHELDPARLRPLERPFTRLLEEFDLSKQGREPLGAAFQGAVYAYIRADAPHLHLEVSRAGAGSKRLGRIGDIDGWDGERLVLSVEVKHFALDETSVGQVEPFLVEVTRRNALALVAADVFSLEAAEHVAARGGRPVDLPMLLSLVDLWDPLKQRAALQAFIYYVHHIEKKKPLMERLERFLGSPGQQPGAPCPAGDA